MYIVVKVVFSFVCWCVQVSSQRCLSDSEVFPHDHGVPMDTLIDDRVPDFHQVPLACA